MIGPNSNSLDIAEHTRAQIARDLMAKWKELPMTDDLKRYRPHRQDGQSGQMDQYNNGEYVRFDDVALLRLEVASLRQERDALKAKLADATDALEEAWYMLTVPAVDYQPEPEETGLRLVKSTLASLRDEWAE